MEVFFAGLYLNEGPVAGDRFIDQNDATKPQATGGIVSYNMYGYKDAW